MWEGERVGVAEAALEPLLQMLSVDLLPHRALPQRSQGETIEMRKKGDEKRRRRRRDGRRRKKRERETEQSEEIPMDLLQERRHPPTAPAPPRAPAPRLRGAGWQAAPLRS